MMMVMVAVVMMVVALFHRHRLTAKLRADLIRSLTFHCGMGDAMLSQFFPHRLFYCCNISIGDNMHGSCISVAVQAPYVQVVGTFYPINLHQVMHNLPCIDSGRDFLQKDIQYGFQISQGIYTDEHCKADGQHRV